MTISCIIPTYNRAEVICETIRQILNQTDPPCEVIVIDQTRTYPAVVEEQLMEFVRDGKIVWLCQMAPNASMARNTGAMLTTGDVLLFLDDDIKVGSDFLRAHLMNYDEKSCNGVAGQILDGNGDVVGIREYRKKDQEWDSLHFPKNFGTRVRTAWMASGNFSIRKDVYFELGGMDEWYEKGANREESDFALRYYRSGRMFQFDPTASIYHLGQTIVNGGGCRSYTSIFGGWHHYVGMWYFAIGFAKPMTFFPMVWTHFRALVLNLATLKRPHHFLLKGAMFVAAFPVAMSRRLRGARLIGRR